MSNVNGATATEELLQVTRIGGGTQCVRARARALATAQICLLARSGAARWQHRRIDTSLILLRATCKH